MNKNITVIYQFTLNENASEKEFMELNAELDTFLLTCEGFQYRSVGKTEESQWLDIIYWDNVDCAKASNIEKLPAFTTLMALINHDSVIVKNAQVESCAFPEAKAKAM